MNEQVAGALREIHRRRQSGIFVCEAGGTKRRLALQSGFIVAGRSSVVEERLGELLIRWGHITEQHFRDASIFIKSGRRMGEILAELRVIKEDDIDHYVESQLTEIACSMVIEPVSRYGFTPLIEVESVSGKPLTVASVLVESGRRGPNVEELVRTFLEDDRPLVMASDPPVRFQDLSLTSDEALLLSRIGGAEPPRALFSRSPLTQEQTARTLVGLSLAGIVELQGEKGKAASEASKKADAGELSEEAGLEHAPARSEETKDAMRADVERLFELFRSQDHWEVLGVNRNASRAEVLTAFQEKAWRYHPDRYQRISDPSFQEKLSYVFDRVRDAFKILSSKTNRPRP